jgi:short subunit dehydrogenase-like uncharacterized protein
MEKYVLVYGAYGHTGRFVVPELLRRGLTPILSGRDPARLGELAAEFPGLEVRQATVDDGESLADAVRGTRLVVNCAGPFLDTAVPVAAAAVGGGGAPRPGPPPPPGERLQVAEQPRRRPVQDRP